LHPEKAKESKVEKILMTQSQFNSLMEKDPMASQLLPEGIEKFDQDYQKLVAWISGKIASTVK
jgi:transaldolase